MMHLENILRGRNETHRDLFSFYVTFSHILLQIRNPGEPER